MWSLIGRIWTLTHNHLVHKWILNYITTWVLLICTKHFTACTYNVTDACHSESTLHNCLDVKELLAWSRRKIWSLSDCTWTSTHNQLTYKGTLNQLANLAKWLKCVVSTYQYAAFDCMLLPCHLRVFEWIHTLQLPECQGTPCCKQAQNLQFLWLQLESNPQPLSSSTNTQPFRKTDQTIELCCEYVTVEYILLYVLVISRTRIRVNPHSVIPWMSLLEACAKSEN